MRVLLTGAGGHLGFNLVRALVTAGHDVRASLRSLDDTAAVERTRSQGALDVVAAPLEDYSALRGAMDGMDALVHSAAIYLFYAPGREHEIVSASVDGVERAFRAAKEAQIKRIVLTSSVAALPLTPAGARPLDESAWNEDLRVPYFRAKTLAERRAWELAEELDLNLVSVLPGPFAGPGFIRPTPTVDLIKSIMTGMLSPAAPPISYPYVDVRDVANAHAMALMSGATGRFIVINEPIPMLADIAREMNRLDPSLQRTYFTLPAFTLPLLPYLEGLAASIGKAPRTMTPELAATMRSGGHNITSARIRRELGWAPTITLAQSLEDTMAAIRALENDGAKSR